MTADLFLREVGAVEMGTDHATQPALRLSATSHDGAGDFKKPDRLLMSSDRTRGNDARDAMARVRSDRRFKCFDRSVHEVGAVSAMDMKVDVTRCNVTAMSVDRR